MDEPTQPEGRSQAPASADPSANTLFFGPDGLRPFWCLVLYFAVLLPIILLIAVSHVASEGSAQVNQISPFDSLVAEWMQFAYIFFAAWVMSRIEDRDVFDYGLSRIPRRARWLGIGAVLGLVFQSLLVLLLWSTHHLVFAGVLLAPLAAVRYGLAWGVMFLGVGFFEEFFFRGYLQFGLTRCFAEFVRYISPRSRHVEAISFWSAAVIISFGFGLVHHLNPGESPIGLFCAGCAGLMFAFSLWRTGSLWWAIGLHAAWDWAQSFLFGVADSGGISEHRLLSTHPAGPPWVSGGATGPEGSIFVLPVMVVITLIAIYTLPRTRTSFLAHPAYEETHLTPEVNSAEG